MAFFARVVDAVARVQKRFFVFRLDRAKGFGGGVVKSGGKLVEACTIFY
jgi:hypothetical protein